MFVAQVYQVEKTRPADTTQYTAKDVVSESATNGTGTAWVFSGAAIGPGMITGFRLWSDKEDMSPQPRFMVHIYKQNPSVELDDNSAFGVVYAQESYKVAEFALPAMTAEDTTAGDGARTQNYDIRFPFPKTADGALYGVVEILDAPTPASGQKFKAELLTVSY